jgi:hypothetical protein
MKDKEMAEQPEKAPPPAVDVKKAAPEKEDGPRKATEAVGLLAAADQRAMAAERARKMAAMQRTMGNARLARVLEGAKAKNPGEGPAKPPSAPGPGEREESTLA